jgi:hypothetical protein
MYSYTVRQKKRKTKNRQGFVFIVAYRMIYLNKTMSIYIISNVYLFNFSNLRYHHVFEEKTLVRYLFGPMMIRPSHMSNDMKEDWKGRRNLVYASQYNTKIRLKYNELVAYTIYIYNSSIISNEWNRYFHTYHRLILVISIFIVRIINFNILLLFSPSLSNLS